MPLSQKPKDKKLMRFIWSFKRKCSPTGELLKRKARLCAHGEVQEKGIDRKNAPAPVVSWNTVCFLLALPMIND